MDGDSSTRGETEESGIRQHRGVADVQHAQIGAVRQEGGESGVGDAGVSAVDGKRSAYATCSERRLSQRGASCASTSSFMAGM